MNEDQLVDRLITSLNGELSPRFLVTPAYASASVEGLSPSARPDIVVSGGDNKVVLIQVKNTGKGQELPLSTAHTTRILSEANAAFHPRVALVTSSKVSPLLQGELDDQNVSVFHLEDLDALVQELLTYISSDEEKVEKAHGSH
ncbi:hypothetical protein [Paraburkholderia sediminicola]|uniref:hypothetical protein n=1 Tax=Paraburkholderia sediminicola TaxID=458836 RepID=UPI0038B80EAD